MTVIDIIGYIGNGLLMLCGAPLAISAFKTKKVKVDPVFIFMWYIGEILAAIYVMLKFGWAIPLLMNYFFNIFAISVVIYYMYWGQNE